MISRVALPLRNARIIVHGPKSSIMSQPIILTTGIYDLIKDQIRRRKVSAQEAEILSLELKHAKQVLRREVPEEVVDIYSRVSVRDVQSGQEETYAFVPPGKAKTKHGTRSIMTTEGLALVGYPKGARVRYPFAGTERELEITDVQRF